PRIQLDPLNLPPSPFFFYSRLRQPPPSPLFPYTTLFRSLLDVGKRVEAVDAPAGPHFHRDDLAMKPGEGEGRAGVEPGAASGERSEEHTSELQSRENLVCRLLLEKKKDTFKKGQRFI